MKRALFLTSLVASTLTLSACHDGYDGSLAVGWSTYPYYGWYDGHYGTIYDGYWGPGDAFYYRLNPHDREFRRGDRQHFRRGDSPPRDSRFQRFGGDLRPPPQGTRMPRFQPPRDRPRER